MIDLAIIGGGPGGYEAALKAAKNRLSVVLIEKNKLGGTCLNEGCIPTKSYYKNAEVFRLIQDAKDYGVNLHNPIYDFKKVKERKDEVVATLNKGIAYSLEKVKVRVIYGEGVLISNDTIKVNDELIVAKNIILAFGSKNKLLPIVGHELLIDSSDLLNLDQLPESIIIVGGGVIGIEFASILNSFGVKVTIIEYLNEILPTLDEEIAKRLRLILKKKGIEIITGAKVIKVEENKNERIVTYDTTNGSQSIIGKEVLASIGRVGNFESNSLEKLGIKIEKGFIKVNHKFETSLKQVYAIGDCNGISLLAHSATFQGYDVVEQILNKNSNINFNVTPSVVFSFPLVATVGLSEKDAKKDNLNYRVVKSFYRYNGKALASNDVEGFIKLLIDENKVIIGGQILGAEANSLIHEIMVLINKKVTIDEARGFIHAHPTLAEIIQQAIFGE